MSARLLEDDSGALFEVGSSFENGRTDESYNDGRPEYVLLRLIRSAFSFFSGRAWLNCAASLVGEIAICLRTVFADGKTHTLYTSRKIFSAHRARGL